MLEFSFAFVVEGFDFDDDASLDLLCETFDDAFPSETAGVTTVSFDVRAAGAWEALLTTLNRFLGAFPQVRVVRLDRDLVSMADIAARVERSNESVRLLVNGKRRSGTAFPAPVGVLGGGTRVWEWSAVSAWFRRELGELADEPESIDAECAALFDAHLTTHGRVAPGLLTRPHRASLWTEPAATVAVGSSRVTDVSYAALAVAVARASRAWGGASIDAESVLVSV